MKIMIFPYIGFTLSWCFFSNLDEQYETYLQDQHVNDTVFEDIFSVLTICARYELFFPTYIINNNGDEIAFEDGDITAVVKQIRKMLTTKEITFEIEKIGGYGYVFLSEQEKVRQDDLIYIDSVRLFERKLNISTSKSLWVPISIDTSYKFGWQVTLAKLNEPRLENCLKEIHKKLNIDVSPQMDEVNKDNPIWQAGFRLYINPEILKREYAARQPTEPFELDKFLYKP